MKDYEIKFYEDLGNWDFSQIKYQTVKKSGWDFYKIIEENTNESSLCLDLGTGGGEKVLKYYPKVGMVIATDLSNSMILTANENKKNYPEKNVKFVKMNNLEMTFPNRLFDLVSARHTMIDAKQVYDSLKDGGILIIEGVDQKDCWDLKELFGRGQAYHDEMSLSEKEYQDVQLAGFSSVEKIEILEEEYYETEEDLFALLVKTPILDDFSEIHVNDDVEHKKIELDLFDEYVRKNKTEKGILLRRVSYGIVGRK